MTFETMAAFTPTAFFRADATTFEELKTQLLKVGLCVALEETVTTEEVDTGSKAVVYKGRLSLDEVHVRFSFSAVDHELILSDEKNGASDFYLNNVITELVTELLERTDVRPKAHSGWLDACFLIPTWVLLLTLLGFSLYGMIHFFWRT